MHLKVAIVVSIALNALADVHDDSLRSVSVVFRHGHRTVIEAYPKDPLRSKTYRPFGLGQLTNQGKLRAYALGEKLRKRYGRLLGTEYAPGLVEAVTTNTDRTKSSLQLVLAALFPPRETDLEWNPSLNWQPVPFDQLPRDSNLLIIPSNGCPKFIKLYGEYMNSTEGRKVDEKYSKYFKYVADNSGASVNTIVDLYDIYNTLSVEKEWKYDLPGWTQKVYPRPLYDAAIDFFLAVTATPQLKQLTGGFLLGKIINDSLERTGPRPKMFAYSGHEFNVVQLLRALEAFRPHVPAYGACVMMELHEINGTYGFEIFYEDHSRTSPERLVVPGCKEFCELTAFVGLLGKNLPDERAGCR